MRLFTLLLLVVIVASLPLAGKYVSKLRDDGMTEYEKTKEIEKVVHNYIIDNPEIIETAIGKLQEKMIVEEAGRKEELYKSNWDQLIANDVPYIGDQDAKIVLVEFFDYRCVYCKKSVLEKMQFLKENPEVKYIMRDLPILNENSYKAAFSALAVYIIAPDKYLDYHQLLMNNDKEITDDLLLGFVEQLGVDYKLYEDTISGKAEQINAIIRNNQELAGDIGLRGTPTFILNAKLLVPNESSTSPFAIEQAKQILSEIR